MDDQISAQAIGDGLSTRLLGRCVIYYEQIGSTNDAAKQLADAGEPEGTVVIADEQTAGRGRLARTWHAPPRSSILMSLIVRPELVPAHAPRVTMAIALGARDAIHAATGLSAQIKWPNDLLIDGKKCAGILAESGIVGDQLDYVIVGLGINVNFALAEIIQVSPRNLDSGNATTIAAELGKPFSRVELAQAVLAGIEKYYLRLRAGENLRDDFARQLIPLGQTVRAQTPWGIETGIAQDVDDDGALLLRRANGSIARLIAGEVTLSQRGT